MSLLNEKEKRVLGALNKLGEVPVSKIAIETLVNRTALYHTIEGLIVKGLVSRVIKNKVAYFRSISIGEYDEWAERKVKSVSEEALEIKNWLSAQKSGHISLFSDVRYFEGEEGVKNLYADTWRDNEEKIIYAITDYAKAYQTMGDFFQKKYFPDRIAHGVKVKNLLPESTYGKRDLKNSKAMLREMRFIDLFKNLGIEINVYGSKIALVTFDQVKPSGVIIKNETMAQAFKRIFDYLWESAA